MVALCVLRTTVAYSGYDDTGAVLESVRWLYSTCRLVDRQTRRGIKIGGGRGLEGKLTVIYKLPVSLLNIIQVISFIKDHILSKQ
jgi:hypothetical protein